MLQKVYGKAPENFSAINKLFHSILGKFPGDKAVKAFEIWMERSQEFPTPADIIGIIKRNGKPPLKESDIITIRKKDGEFRTRDEWKMLEEWDAQQNESCSEFQDDNRIEADLQENIRLRDEVRILKQENHRLSALVHELRVTKRLEQPKPDVQTKISNTVEFMKADGASEDDIDLFIEQMGGKQEQRLTA